MAQRYQPTALGVRLAALRRSVGLSAAGLADRIPSERITRAVIANIESGRKPEPTYIEMVLIASGLGVSPARLAFDTADPWAPIDIEGLAQPYGHMSTLEYLVSTDPLHGPGASFSWVAAEFVAALFTAEEVAYLNEVSELLERNEIRTSETMGLSFPTGRANFDYERLVSRWTWEDRQHLVDVYRQALAAAALLARAPDARRLPLPVQERLEMLGGLVARILAEDPDLDYGQKDRADAYRPTPALDPSTGRPT